MYLFLLWDDSVRPVLPPARYQLPDQRHLGELYLHVETEGEGPRRRVDTPVVYDPVEAELVDEGGGQLAGTPGSELGMELHLAENGRQRRYAKEVVEKSLLN